MNSFTFAPDPAGGADQFQFVQWMDPNEGAFTVEAPSGWPWTGGLMRENHSPKMDVWRLHSPDHAIQIFFGDEKIPYFIQQGQPGTFVSNWRQKTMQVRPFQRADQFLAEYIPQRFGNTCSLSGFRHLPGIEQIFSQRNDISMPGLGISRPVASVFEASFTCKSNGQDRLGLVTAIVVLQPYLDQWEVQNIYGFLSPPAYRDLSSQILNRIVPTHRRDPFWSANQSRHDYNLGQRQRETQLEIGKIHDAAWRRSREARDRMAHDFCNAILGRQDVLDPMFGQVLSVPWTTGPLWRDSSGLVIGTDSGVSPGLDFHRLFRF